MTYYSRIPRTPALEETAIVDSYRSTGLRVGLGWPPRRMSGRGHWGWVTAWASSHSVRSVATDPVGPRNAVSGLATHTLARNAPSLVSGYEGETYNHNAAVLIIAPHSMCAQVPDVPQLV